MTNTNVGIFEADELLKQADLLEQQQQYRKSIALLQHAINAYKDHKLWESVVDCANTIAQNYIALGLYQKAQDWLTYAQKIAHKKLDAGGLNIARTFFVMAWLHSTQKKYSSAVDFFTRALGIQLSILGMAHPDIADTFYRLGQCYKDIGNFKQAVFCFEKALNIYNSYQQATDTAGQNLQQQLADAYMNAGKYSEATELYQQQLHKQLNLWTPPLFKIAALYTQIGKAYCEKSDYEHALQAWDNAIAYYNKEKVMVDNPLVAEIYNLQGNCYMRQSNYEQAMAMHQKALQTYRNISHVAEGEPDFNIIDTLYCIGDCYYAKADYDEALKYLHRACTISQDLPKELQIKLADGFDKLALCYQMLDGYDIMLSYLNRSIQIKQQLFYPQHPQIAKSYVYFAAYYLFKAHYDKAQQYLNKALSIQKATLYAQHLDFAFTYSYFAVAAYHNSQFADMSNYLKQSLHILSLVYGNWHPSIAKCYSNMGLCYTAQQRFDKAEKAYANALRIYERVFTKAHPDMANTYNNYGLTYHQKGNYEKAIAHFSKALLIWEDAEGSETLNIATVLNNYGLCLLDTTNYQEALKHLLKALAIRLNLLEVKHPLVAITYRSIGKCYHALGNYLLALSNYQASLKSLVSDFNNNNNNIYHNPNLDNYSSATELLETLHLKSASFEQAFMRRYVIDKQNPRPNIHNLLSAFDTLKTAIQLIDEMRHSYKSDDAQKLLLQRAKPIYENGIRIAIRLFNATDNEEYLHTAFNYSEKSQGILMLSYLKDVEAKISSNINQGLLAEEKKLRQQLIYIDKNIANEWYKTQKSNTELIDKWSQEHFTLSKQYDELIEQLEATYPDYYNIKYNINTTEIKQLQATLASDTLLLSYFVGEKDIFLFAVDKSSYQVFSIEKKSNFNQQINDFIETIEEVSRKAFIKQSYQLYQQLLEQPLMYMLRQKNSNNPIRKLLIVPDANLFYLPFEALLYKSVELSTTYKKLPYLVNEFAVSYHYSATLYHYISHRKQAYSPKNTEIFMGMAPVYAKELYTKKEDTISLNNLDEEKLKQTLRIHGRKYKELVYSQYEVNNIQQLFEGQNWHTQVFFHAKASKQNFITHAPNAQYLHIAAHGVNSKKRPDLSGIIFHPQKDDTVFEEAIFYIAETYLLKLNAKLVILSSCESGIGQLVKGEGMIAINRGFLYAGADNIIFTLFKVYDQPSFELTKKFYQNILKHQHYSLALQKAKHYLIQKNDTTPLSWAGFVLIGQ